MCFGRMALQAMRFYICPGCILCNEKLHAKKITAKLDLSIYFRVMFC